MPVDGAPVAGSTPVKPIGCVDGTTVVTGAVVGVGEPVVDVGGADTVTTNDDAAWLPAASVAVHVTVCAPIENVLPDAGTQATVGVKPELSTAEGWLKVTTTVD